MPKSGAFTAAMELKSGEILFGTGMLKQFEVDLIEIGGKIANASQSVGSIGFESDFNKDSKVQMRQRGTITKLGRMWTFLFCVFFLFSWLLVVLLFFFFSCYFCCCCGCLSCCFCCWFYSCCCSYYCCCYPSSCCHSFCCPFCCSSCCCLFFLFVVSLVV